jgi:MFS family permease
MLLVEEVVLNLTPHVMSNFSQSAHSVLSVLPMVLGILSGVLRLPMAKIIDRHGRKNGFHLAWLIWNLGLLFLTGAQSLAATVAGQIFYGIGSSLLDFVFTVILADMTSLKNRGMIFSCPASTEARHNNHSLPSRLPTISSVLPLRLY